MNFASQTAKENRPQETADVPDNWPAHGTIEFKNVSASYTADENLVIRNLCMNIEAGQKIGICGMLSLPVNVKHPVQRRLKYSLCVRIRRELATKLDAQKGECDRPADTDQVDPAVARAPLSPLCSECSRLPRKVPSQSMVLT